MLLDQSKFANNDSLIKKHKKRALTQACMTIAESTRLGASLYYATDIYEFSKKIISELSLTDEEFHNLANEVAERLHLQGNNLSEYGKKISELLAYEVIEIQ